MAVTLNEKPVPGEHLMPDAAEREQARQRLDEMLGITNPVPGAPPFYERATPEEWVTVFHLWTRSHDPDTPVLLDDSREVIYED